MGAIRKSLNLWTLALLAGLLAACHAATGEPNPAVTQPALPPLSNAPDAAIQAQAASPGREANLKTVEAIVQESFPVQVQALIRGWVPDSCTTVAQVNQARNGHSFEIALATLRQTDAICAQQPQSFEKTMALDVTGLPAGAYTINAASANSVSTTFALTVDNVPPAAPPTPELVGASITGLVWADTCQLNSDASPGSNCVAAANGGYHADGAFNPTEPRLAGVQVTLKAGECAPDTPPMAVATTDTGGAYLFTGLAAGTYCVAIDPASAQNLPVLQPGNFTYPGENQGNVTLTLQKNDYQTSDFGWFRQNAAAPTTTTATDNCDNAAEFVADVTIPDDSVLTPGEPFTKTWRLKNTGTCTWGPEYKLMFSSGDQLNGPGSVSLPQPVAPDAETELSVALTAPTAPGAYHGEWILQSPTGAQIGSDGAYPLYVQIIVSD